MTGTRSRPSLCMPFVVLVAALAWRNVCAQVRRPSGVRPDSVEWRVADSLTVDHLDVKTSHGWSRLPLVAFSPDQLPDRSLLLRVVQLDQSIVFRRYVASTGRVVPVAAPPDYDSSSTLPTFSARRLLVAYDAGGRVVVRRWPRWDFLVTGPAIEGCSDTLLGIEFSPDGRWVIWYPPHCSEQVPDRDSLAVRCAGVGAPAA